MPKLSSSHGVINPTKQVTNVGRRQNPTFIKTLPVQGDRRSKKKGWRDRPSILTGWREGLWEWLFLNDLFC